MRLCSACANIDRQGLTLFVWRKAGWRSGLNGEGDGKRNPNPSFNSILRRRRRAPWIC